MCGISGFVKVAPGPGTAGDLIHMMEAIQHRGPDGHGIHDDGIAYLGHRRLSIVDLAGGHQPMSNEDGTLWITFNGEIFNHASLRPELEAAGHLYRSRSDTETILHAYEQFGAAAIERFRGMFSFAVWNQKTRQLTCVRDRLGIKPFYYHFDGKSFVFASEIKALLRHPSVTADFADEFLSEYLTFGYLAGDNTFFKGIRKLMPGHMLTLNQRQGTIDIRRYWDVPALPATEIESHSDEEWIQECRRRLEQTVEMRLMSDVPLGMFLSGGVDSSAIAALMKHMRSEPVKTFAVGYQEAEFSELGFARTVAQTIGTDHHEVVLGREEFFAALPKLVWHEDEPIAWPSSVSLFFVSRLASQHVKVVLTGEGSDELFAGYQRYQHFLFNRKWADRYQVLPSSLRKTVRDVIAHGSYVSADLRRKLQHTFLGREDTVESLQLDNFYGAFAQEERHDLLRDPKGLSQSYSAYLAYWNARDGSTLSKMLYADQKTYLVELLMKQDQMSMACSIESRVPFLDHTFVEFASRVPDQLKIRNGTGKYIVKKAVEDVLPHDIIYRKKMGFPTPLRQWFRDASAANVFAPLLQRNSFMAEYVNVNAVERLIDKQRRGLEDATDRLWRLLNLQIWGDLFITGKTDQYQPAPDGATTEVAV